MTFLLSMFCLHIKPALVKQQQSCLDSDVEPTKEKRHLSFWAMCSWVTNRDPGVHSEPVTQKTATVQSVNEGGRDINM